MLIFHPGICCCESFFGSNGVLLLLRKGANICSSFWIVDICDRHIGVIPSFLHSRSRELESGNPPQHVTTATVQGHKLLEAVQEDVRSTLDKQRRK